MTTVAWCNDIIVLNKDPRAPMVAVRGITLALAFHKWLRGDQMMRVKGNFC